MSSPLSASAGTPGVSPRPSFDLERPITPSLHLNGSVAATELTASENYDDTDPIQRLQRELERTKADKDTLAAQYRNLLAKLTAMRTTLGNKLKQDAVRRHSVSLVLLYDLHMHRKNSTARSSSCNISQCRMKTSLLL